MSTGKIVQIIGAVVDAEFPREALPKVYDALVLDGDGLTLEVQQQLGDGIVRCIAMGTTDGLRRGTGVKNTGHGCTLSVLGYEAFTRPKSFHLRLVTSA